MSSARVASRIEYACKSVLVLRAWALLITSASSMALGDAWPVLAWANVLAAVLSLALVLQWERWATRILRHPFYLCLELCVAFLVLAGTGVDSPIYFFTLGTAALAGLLYGRVGALVCSALLIVEYLLVLLATEDVEGFMLLIGMPALYVMVALAAATARTLMDRDAEGRVALEKAQAVAAAERERASLAREMHDSLGKMLYGLAMSATVLAHREGGDSSAAAQIAEDARAAAERARELVSGLREEVPESLDEALRERVSAWSKRSRLELDLAVVGAGQLTQTAARELLAIADEAVANVVEHAQASKVRLVLEYSAMAARLSIEDDGMGFVSRGELPGHYGLRGMRERVRLVGGQLVIDSQPGKGTSVVATVPAHGEPIATTSPHVGPASDPRTSLEVPA